MKHVLQTARPAFIVLAVASIIGLTTLQAHAENTNDLPLVQPESVPQSGTFWKLSSFNAASGRFIEPPVPFNPASFYNLTNGDFYLLRTNSFVLDDRSIDWNPIYEAKREELSMSLLFSESGGEERYDVTGSESFPSNSLFLEITDRTRITNGFIGVTLHNTTPDLAYDLLYKLSLASAHWTLDQQLIGSEGTNSTFTWVSMTGRTNLFLWAKSWVDSDGSGLADWWQLQNFGHLGVDPYADPDNDGWNNLEEFRNETNPNVFNTPPAPVVTVTPLPNDNGVIVSWQPSQGAVTGYTLYRDGLLLTNLPASQTSFEDDSVQVSRFSMPFYQVRAHYAGGDSPLSVAQRPASANLAISTTIVRGSRGQYILVIPSIPGGATTVRVYRSVSAVAYPDDFEIYTYEQPEDYFTPSVTGGYFDVAISSFTNGQYVIPTSLMPLYGSYSVTCIAFGPNGTLGPASETSKLFTQLDDAFVPFVDGSEQLKQNLAFALEAADGNGPFRFGLDVNQHPPPPSYNFPSNYAYASFHLGLDLGNPAYRYSFLQEFKPFEDNYFLRNFLYSPTNVNSDGSLASGVYYNPSSLPTILIPPQTLFSFPEYAYVSQGSTNLLSPKLSATNSQWIYSGYQPPDTSQGNIGIGDPFPYDTLYLTNGAKNIFGLSYQSVLRLYNDGSLHTDTVTAGGNIPDADSEYFYGQVEPPQLQTVGYFFGVPNRDYLPGHVGFDPTNATPLMVAAVGQLLPMTAWAKQQINNGYAGKFAYLEQYFDAAYKIGTNGVVTTNKTGILSPYGEFFPTEPGPTALVTMPDLDTGQRGTGVVNVIKLQLDVNHDGVMDLSFGGPDNTSFNKPFVFWVNNDYDRRQAVGSDPEDDFPGGSSPYTNAPTPDCEYRNSLGDRIIPSARDVEDFARLWIGGVSTNLFASLPAGVTAELSWGDKGNPNTNNPTIDVFGTADTDGGIGYLTNYLTAWQQSSNYHIGDRLGPGGSIPVVFSNSFGWQGWNRAIWCGVKKGSGALTLTFTQGTNKIIETSAYIDVKDIKEMYERWTVGDNPQIAPTNRPFLARDGLPTGAPPLQYTVPSDTNTPYILQVHDYDLPMWKKDRFAETAFKRLYWQGYQGRFGLFRWPGVTNSARPLDDSESNAWRSGVGLLNLLTNLDAQYPGKVHLIAHGYGAIVAGEALRLAGTNEVVNTYIAMQGAVASHAYDPFAPIRLLASGTDSGTPNRYALYYTNTAPYFYGVGGAGAYINYFNTNDYVLTNLWRSTEDTKPDLGYHWDGTNFSKGFIPPYSLLLFPVDTYEIFSYCDEARCEAIGAQPNLGGAFSVSRQVDLSALPYNFGGKEKDHSAEFLSYCADRWEFWDAVLRSMGLKQ